MNPHTSRPVRASMASRMPRFVPAQMSVRRSLFVAAKPGYASSGGGSSDGGFKKPGVESITAPSPSARTWAITLLASIAFKFMSDASVAVFDVVNGINVPEASAVKRLRRLGSKTAQPVGGGVGPGAHATQMRVPSDLNLYPVGCD